MIPQLPLALRWPRRQRFEHFHAGANAAALAAVQALAADRGAPWVYLHGASGSGRSHLLLAACQAANAAGRRVQYLPLATLGRPRRAPCAAWPAANCWRWMICGAIAGKREAEHALFDLYNRARAEGGALLFAADATPAAAGHRAARPALAPGRLHPVRAQAAGRRRTPAVLKAQAAARGIELDDSRARLAVRPLRPRSGRLLDLLDRLDQASLAAQRRITVPFLRGVLRDAGDGS